MDHILFARETTWGTYVAPDFAIPVISSNINGNQPRMPKNVTGTSRGRQRTAVGEFTAGGSMSTYLYPTMIGKLLRSVFGTRAKVAAGTGYKNKLLPEDNTPFDSFSAQRQLQQPGGSMIAQSARGLKINRWQINARAREYATIDFDFLGKDVAMSGDFWPDGNSAPTVVTPIPYPTPPIPDAFTFYQGVLRLGGTEALTSGEIVITSGTARGDFDNISVTANYNLAEDALGVNLGDRTRQKIPEGERTVDGHFEPNWDTLSTSGKEIFLAWKDGTDAVVELFFQGPIYNASSRYELKVTLPQVHYTTGGIPDTAKTYGLRRIPVDFIAEVDDTLGLDIGLVLQTTEDYTV